MSHIALPKKIDHIVAEPGQRGTIVVEPLFPGYGITLGNSLRRVLLSSLPGAAPIGIKIKGVEHEFMTLPHLKEDILEFILNLKKLRVILHTDEPTTLTIDVHGAKEVTAADIKPNAQATVVNPELVIGHITDMAGSLNAEIFLGKGMGYVTIENRESKPNKEIGYIEMDSIFSPILSVGISVENTRVGKMTNWDKLSLDILSDGTIDPKDAFDQAVAILIEQYSAMVPGLSEAAPAPVAPEETESEDEDDEPKKKRGRKKADDTETAE